MALRVRVVRLDAVSDDTIRATYEIYDDATGVKLERGQHDFVLDPAESVEENRARLYAEADGYFAARLERCAALTMLKQTLKQEASQYTYPRP